MVACPHCSTSNRPLAKFCMKCVAPLGATTSGSAGREPTHDDRTAFYDRTHAINRSAGDHLAPPPPSFSEHALPEGTLIEGLHIVRPIGEGGFGIVYLAWDAALERQVAIKEYLPSSLVGRAASSLDVTMRSQRFRETFDVGLKSFVNEARLLARFDHPSLIKVFRFWEGHRTAYMAMPYYEGPTLKDALAEMGRAVTERQLREWIEPLLDALAVIHRENCYHRDISPDNILLTAAGPLLLDFGAARRVITDMTQALTAVLKPGFAPIEQYGGGLPQGPWTDLYALAGVVFYAITGRPPVASAVRAVNDTVQPLAVTHAGRYSATFLRAIDAALAVRPEARPQDVVQFRALLRQGAAPSASARPPESASAPRRNGLDDFAGRTSRGLPFAATEVSPRVSPRVSPVVPVSAVVSVEPVQAARPPAVQPEAVVTAKSEHDRPVGVAAEPLPTPSLASAAATVFDAAAPVRKKRGGVLPIAACAVMLLAAGSAWMFSVRPTPASAAASAPATPIASTPPLARVEPEAVAPPEATLTTAAAVPSAAPVAPVAPVASVANVAPVAAPVAIVRADVPAQEAPRRVATRSADKPASVPVARKAKASDAPQPAAEGRRQPAPESEVVSYNKEQPRPTRCTDVVLKSSLEPLSPEEIAFLKKNCR